MKTAELTNNEKSVLVAIVENAKSVGDTGIEFILQDVAKATGKSIRSISATAGSLANKGMLLCANGESYFDGEVTEAGLHEVEENNKVNQEVNNKNQSNMEDKNFESPVMDNRIVKLNEIIGVRLASISSKKRPAVKEAKELAKYILANWDDESQLLKIKSEDVNNDTVKEVLSSRLQNFIDAKNACKKAVEELEAPKVYKDVNDKEIKAGDFVKDLSTEGSEPCEVFDEEGELAVNVDGTTVYFSEIETEKVFEIVDMKAKEPAQPKTKKTASKAEAKKTDKEKQPKEKTAKTARKVGDVHPKHPTWVWTEYAPGKFDWRTNPKDKKQGQRTDMADKKEKQPKSKAADKKAAKGKEAKQEAPKKAEKPIYTIDEWVALPTKTTTAKSKMSEAQKEAFKLINKGCRITADKKFFENDKDDRKSCNWASVEAMLKRYGIDYVPMGLIKENKDEK